MGEGLSGAAGTRAGLLRALQAQRTPHCLLQSPAGGWALVVPALGARLLGAGCGERNAFWVSPALKRCLQGRDWNAGGQRTWLAPELGPRGFFGAAERDWRVPPALDPGAYRLLEAGPRAALCRGDCRLTAADGEGYELQLARRVELCDLPEGGILLRLRHCLRNAGPRPLRSAAGLWSILQLPCQPEGELSLPEAQLLPRFGELPPGWLRRGPGRLLLRTAPGRRWKVGQPPCGEQAELAHRRPTPGGEVRVSVRFPVRAGGAYLDGGDALQAYNSPLAGPEAFCELEGHAPAPVLEPGQEEGQDVEIEVHCGP